jgi:uncharacterized protein YjfI (DUF2170 family)
MLAALIATRQPAPPPPAILFYTNQFIAATNVFVCTTVCRRAAFITTSLPIRHTLSLSLPGAESTLDQLNRFYYRIINYLSSNANIIPLPADLYLSNQIVGAIATATTLTGILATLPVLQANLSFLGRLRAELAQALANLKALGKPL